MLQIPRRRRSNPATTAQHHSTLPPCPSRHLQEGGGARRAVVDLSQQDMGFLLGMEREGEGTNLDGASKEGNGTGRCRRRRGQRTSQGFLPVQVRDSWQSTFTDALDLRPPMTRSGVQQRCGGREAAFRSGRETGRRPPAATGDSSRRPSPPSRPRKRRATTCGAACRETAPPHHPRPPPRRPEPSGREQQILAGGKV